MVNANFPLFFFFFLHIFMHVLTALLTLGLKKSEDVEIKHDLIIQFVYHAL